MRKLLGVVSVLAFIYVFPACGTGHNNGGDAAVNDDVGQSDVIQTDGDHQSDAGPVHLRGGAQKGPYQPGSQVSCTKLDAEGFPTSETFSTTTDSTGMFVLNLTVGVYQCQASGFYWKEDEGKYSGAATTMYALVNVTSDGASTAFINPRTNFVAKRAIALISTIQDAGTGMAPDEAILQAESEVNGMGFKIPPPAGLPLSTAMNLLGGDNDANREVFRVDCALMYAAQIKAADPSERDAQLQSLLNRGALEVANTGAFSDDFKALIGQAEQYMNPEVCKYYLQKYITDNGLSGIILPDIQSVVDTDGNGIANAGEPNPGMVLVPAGEFLMGEAQTPVTLPDFYIDMYEVSVSDYKACVDASICSAPVPAAVSDSCNWGVSGKEFHPVNCVTWDQAGAYCQWVAGGTKHLPSDAEWEKAARGTDGRMYPWGNTPGPSCANSVMYDAVTQKYGCGSNGTQPVGSRLNGQSPYGAKDMLGNVAEWTQETNWRGGCWQMTSASPSFSTYTLSVTGPIVNGDTFGFRCAK